LDRTGFALDVNTFLQARETFAIARRKKLGRQDAPRDGKRLALWDAEIKAHDVNGGAPGNASFSPRAGRRPG
jgi:hypothetical protein